MTDKNFFDRANDSIRSTESSVVNLLSALAPWGAPLAPAYMAYGGMTAHLGFVWWVAGVLAFVIEILGLATVSTTLQFWQHNRRYKMAYKQQPTHLAAGMFGLYLLIILTVNILLEAYTANLITWAWTPILARGLLSLLSVPAAVTMAIRTQHTEMLHDIQGQRADKSATKADKPTNDAMSQNVVNVGMRDATFGRGYTGFVEYMHLLEKQGRGFDKETTAREMGRSVRQVERYMETGRSNGVAEQLTK